MCVFFRRFNFFLLVACEVFASTLHTFISFLSFSRSCSHSNRNDSKKKKRSANMCDFCCCCCCCKLAWCLRLRMSVENETNNTQILILLNDSCASPSKNWFLFIYSETTNVIDRIRNLWFICIIRLIGTEGSHQYCSRYNIRPFIIPIGNDKYFAAKISGTTYFSIKKSY